MAEAFPQAIITRLTRLGSDLAAWSRTHQDVSLADQEQAVLALVRAALPDLLVGVQQGCTRALRLPVAGLRQPCPRCGQRQGSHQWRVRQVLTVCGSLTFERPYYYCRRCHHGWAPADSSLGLPPSQRVSAGLQAWLVRLGATTDYREAAALLEQLTGLALVPETVRHHTGVGGTALEAAQQAAMAMVVRTGEAAAPVAPAPGRLVVETDGVMVRYRDGWHEVKLGLVGGHQAGKTGALSYVAARESAEQFGPRLAAEAARRGALEVVGGTGPLAGRGLAQLRPVVVLGDGAPWIWNLAADHFGERTEIVDFYHASEHVWTVAHALYPSDSAQAKTWAEARVGDLYEDGPGPVLAALREAQPPNAEAAEVVRREHGYFRTNQLRMAYPQFRRQGLPIGSGAVESGAKHVVQLRMKRPGARWSATGAHAVLTLRAHLSSGRSLVAVHGCAA